jgi:recombination protein RecA
VAAPFREAEFDIMYDSGISSEGDLIDLAVNEEVVQKSGAWFSYGEVRLGQGREPVKQFLKDNPDLLEEIRTAVLRKKGLLNGEKVQEPATPVEEPAKSKAKK